VNYSWDLFPGVNNSWELFLHRPVTARPAHWITHAQRLTFSRTMANTNSFDVTTGADLQEVDNAVNQATKEIQQRYDFKGTKCSIEFDRTKSELNLDADDDYKLKALYDVLQSKFVKRGVPLKNMKPGTVEQASGGRVRQVVALTQGIPTDTAKQIVKDVKAHGGFKKVQVAIQGDQLRVSSPSKDELQNVIGFLKGQDYGIELNFGNYR
jgi:cyclic-di-GMP-binding protein